MTNKTKIIIGVGSAVALVGGYFIYKALRPKKPMDNPLKVKTDEEKPPIKDDTKPTTDTTPTIDSGECKRYIVDGVSDYVNIRSTPSTSLREIDFLYKKSTVSAKPSSTSGWMELCDMKGFISSKYLKPFVPKSTKCVLQKGLKFGYGTSEDGYYNKNRKFYHQNFKDLRNGFWYQRYIETEKPFEYFEGSWYRRLDNKDIAKESFGRNDVVNGKLDPNSIINTKEIEEFYQSGNVC